MSAESHPTFRRNMLPVSLALLVICLHAGFLLGLLDAEDGGVMFLRNTSWLSAHCTGLYPLKTELFIPTAVRAENPIESVSWWRKRRLISKILLSTWPPLWSSGQSSWLQIQRCGLDSRRYQISWEVVGLERGPLILVSTTEELLGRKSSGSGLESRRDPSRWPHGILYL
jgi:hypothetical protein